MDLRSFFYPRSIVVLGVSDSVGNLGREIIKNLNRFGFGGEVYGLGRRAMEIEGRKVFADLADIAEIPELAVLIVPAPTIVDALEACGRKGIRHAVIEAGGFTEFGSDRKVLEESIRAVARSWSITCLGPNCIGTINVDSRICLPFVPFDPEEIRPGRNSFISQSGGLIHELVRRCAAENVGLDKLASVGNKLLVDECEVLEFLIDDEATTTIGLYLEDIKDGRRLMDLAARSRKPIILLKGNASPAGREIASFHTAALVGDEAVTTAALRQAGVHQVSTLQEMVELFKVFSLPPMKGNKVAVISRSGGQSVLLADEAHRHGFELARLSPSIFDAIKERSKGGVIKRTNPVDLGDVFDEIFYLEVLDKVLGEESVDGVVFFFDYEINPTAVLDMVRGANDRSRLHRKPVLLCLVPHRAHWFLARDAASFPIFSHPQWAFDGLSRSLAHYTGKTAGRTWVSLSGPSWKRETTTPGQEASPPLASQADALALMKEYGIPVVDHAFVRDAATAAKAASVMGYPVVLKKADPLVLHKTEAGAVRPDIRNDRELEEAVGNMPANLYLLQKHLPSGIDSIIGGKRDPEFGPVVVFGLGGIFVEVIKDVTMRVAPVDADTAREMIGEIRGSSLFEGVRGMEPADVESLARVVAAVSRLLADHPEIGSLDINPLRVFRKGDGCSALDVKIGISR